MLVAPRAGVDYAKQVLASELFGGQEIHSTHGVHPKAPNKHIFRLSNDQVRHACVYACMRAYKDKRIDMPACMHTYIHG